MHRELTGGGSVAVAVGVAVPVDLSVPMPVCLLVSVQQLVLIQRFIRLPYVGFNVFSRGKDKEKSA